MKKLMAILLLLISWNLTFGQMVTITGVSSNRINGNTKINLLWLDNGALKTLSSTTYGLNGEFGFLVSIPYEGFYAIGQEDLMSGQNPVYLKSGDVVNVIIAEDGKHMIFKGKNTPENVVLGKWLDLSKEAKRISLYFDNSNASYVEFFPVFAKLVEESGNFLKAINTTNKQFNKRMTNLIGYDLDLFALNLLTTPRTKHPSKDSLPDFYSKIVKKNRFPDDDIFNTIYGLRLLREYFNYANKEIKGNDIERRMSVLSTDRQKAECLCGIMLSRIKTYENYQDFEKTYGKYFTLPYLKQRMENKGAEVYTTKTGSIAADFTYPDASGTPVSLSSFKGKVVLVDVWATWCGPCKAEIPSLKKLEEEMHGTDLVVMSVSVDQDKDKAKWLKMIADEKLGGIQLFASGWSKICKDYKIDGIPRFMVFDKNGNVVTIDAPRPSDPKLKELLMAELSK